MLTDMLCICFHYDRYLNLEKKFHTGIVDSIRKENKLMKSGFYIHMIGRAINDVTINGIFGAGGDTMFDMYSLAVCMWCLAIPLAAAGTYYFHWPVVVVYACTCIDEVGKLPWVLHHFQKYKWVKDLTR